MSIKKWVISPAFFVGLLLLPIYAWSSGGVQFSHVILAAASLLSLLYTGARLDSVGGLFVLLLAWVGLRDGLDVMSHGEVRRLLPVAYIAFIGLVYLGTKSWVERGSWQVPTRLSLVGAATIAICGVFILGYGATIDFEGKRSIGTFNNPNQLGYFSVCLLSISSLLYLAKDIEKPWLLALGAASIFLAIASLSKAAMISCAFASVFMGFVIGRSRMRVVLGIALLTALVVVAYYAIEAGYLDQFRFFRRLSTIGTQGDDSAAGRGYNVFLSAGALELLFGFGAERVNVIVGHELHSTIGSFFSNYGAVGGLIFVAIIAVWAISIVKAFGVRGILVVVVPPMLYGLTHNGSRFTIFWVLVGMSVALSNLELRRRGVADVGAQQRVPR